MNSNNKGCAKTSLIGCAALIFISFLFFVLVFVFSTNFSFSTSDSFKTDGKFSITDSTIDANEKITSTFSWLFVDEFLKTKKVTLSLDILTKDVNNALFYLDAISKMSYRELGVLDNEQYDDPQLHSKEVWEQIYSRIYQQGFTQVEKVSAGFKNIFKTENLSLKNRILFLITFVQNINYKRPAGSLDILPPIVALAKKFGDCDTKSLLLYILLEKMGVDCVLFWSYNYKHAMLGVALNASGTYKNYKGKKYYFLETTYPDWGVGQIAPDTDNLNYWYVADLDDEMQNENYPKESDFKQNDNRDMREKNKKPSPARH